MITGIETARLKNSFFQLKNSVFLGNLRPPSQKLRLKHFRLSTPSQGPKTPTDAVPAVGHYTCKLVFTRLFYYMQRHHAAALYCAVVRDGGRHHEVIAACNKVLYKFIRYRK